MKLVLVISSLSSGGAERVMTDMANYWVSSGWDITLVTLSGDEMEDFYPLLPSVHRIKLGLQQSTSNPRDKLMANFHRVMTLRRLFRQHEPDAVISFLDVTNVLTLMATRGLDVRVIVSERINPAVNPCLGKVWQLLRKYLYRFAECVVAQTHEAANWVEKDCKAKTTVIINPLRQLPEIDVMREPFLLSIGRLHSQKGHDQVLQAFAKVRSEFPDWKLVILGEGPERSMLENLCDQLGLHNVVQMPGTVTNPEQWMARAGLVVQASRFEGFPNVLLEAMGMGAAVISSNCRSGPAEIISEGVNGRLVPVDDVESLAQVMAELMSDQGLRERLGQAARLVRNKYSQSAIMIQWNSKLGEK